MIDFILHIDTHLLEFVQNYGTGVHGILFAIVFAETGLVVTPFLPGDSLLFAAGAIAATGALDVRVAIVVLLTAAIAGDAVNYTAGHIIGPRVFSATGDAGISNRVLNRQHLQRAHQFFERYGGKAIILGRFVPIVRTFVPFVAGAGEMSYPAFAFYNVTGAIAWVGICVGAGYLFGNLPAVKENFSLVTIGIVAVSVLPMVIEYLMARRQAR